ncbi:hypothetical protein CAPTEDRAFT_203813 [Capitella teleta]|uniref:Uncharacterized protein n=1 Tax=Capitella teleta TaxID=283909 RepID=R7UGT4_CAPTE|nr:hypothetical protein CAPTEDRAFT_203813 [Capitella teleta]|eukprot:ELU02993.1 hypothetical protein CAPTEDRAFT_203813 [Capitella teleta]
MQCRLPETGQADTEPTDISVQTEEMRGLFIRPCGNDTQDFVYEGLRGLLETVEGREHFKGLMQSSRETAGDLARILQNIKSSVDRESVLHAQYREFLKHAAQQSFYAVPSHSNGDGPVVRWKALIVGLFKAMSKIYSHLDITAKFFSQNPVQGIGSLSKDLKEADDESIRLLCGMHDGLRLLHVHNSDQSVASDSNSDQSWNEWAHRHGDDTHSDLVTLEIIRNQFGGDQLDMRAFYICGLRLCLNTIRDIQSEFQRIESQLTTRDR